MSKSVKIVALLVTLQVVLSGNGVAQTPDQPKGEGRGGQIAIRDQISRQRAIAQTFEEAFGSLVGIHQRLRRQIEPTERAKTEVEFWTQLKEKTIPALRLWADDIRARRQGFVEAGDELQQAVQRTVALYNAEAGKLLAAKTRTKDAGEQVKKLAEGMRTKASEYAAYGTEMKQRADTMLHLLQYSEDVGIILDGLDALARGGIDVAAKKQGAEERLKEARALLESVARTVTKALDVPVGTNSTKPATPGINGAPTLPAVPSSPPEETSRSNLPSKETHGDSSSARFRVVHRTASQTVEGKIMHIARAANLPDLALLNKGRQDGIVRGCKVTIFRQGRRVATLNVLDANFDTAIVSAEAGRLEEADTWTFREPSPSGDTRLVSGRRP